MLSLPPIFFFFHFILTTHYRGKKNPRYFEAASSTLPRQCWSGACALTRCTTSRFRWTCDKKKCCEHLRKKKKGGRRTQKKLWELPWWSNLVGCESCCWSPWPWGPPPPSTSWSGWTATASPTRTRGRPSLVVGVGGGTNAPKAEEKFQCQENPDGTFDQFFQNREKCKNEVR